MAIPPAAVRNETQIAHHVRSRRALARATLRTEAVTCTVSHICTETSTLRLASCPLRCPPVTAKGRCGRCPPGSDVTFDRFLLYWCRSMLLFCTYPLLCAGALWPMPVWVWRDAPAASGFSFFAAAPLTLTGVKLQRH